MRFKKIYIEITNICNKNCNFCSKDNLPKKEMSIKEFEYILKQIKPYANYIYLHVKGEPLLHSNFAEILNLCIKYDIFVNLTTNGTYLFKYKEVLKQNPKIRQINISLQSYNKKDNLDEIIDAVNCINQNTNINIVYRFWTLKNNKFTPQNLKLIDILINNYHFKLEDAINNQNIKIQNRIYINKDNLFVWPTLETNIEKETFCYGLKTHIAILSNGTVIPCCLDSSGIINLGNIYNESLEAILNKEKTRKIVHEFQNNKCSEELCKKCKYRLNL